MRWNTKPPLRFPWDRQSIGVRDSAARIIGELAMILADIRIATSRLLGYGPSMSGERVVLTDPGSRLRLVTPKIGWMRKKLSSLWAAAMMASASHILARPDTDHPDSRGRLA
jgi:hypothetical protein